MSVNEHIAAVEQQIASQGAPVAESAPIVESPVNPAEHEDQGQGESAAPEEANEEGKPSPRRKTAQERLEQVLAERKEDRKRAKIEAEEKEYWRQQALKTQAPSPSPSSAAAKPQGKTLEDFGWDQDAFLQHQIQEGVVREVKRQEQARVQQAEQERVQSIESAFQTRVKAFEAAHPDVDFESDIRTNNDIPISTPMAEYIKESDVGPELALYFRDNPTEAKDIFSKSPAAAYRHLSKLEDKLTGSSSPSIPPEPVQITRAPPVPGRVSTSSAGRPSPKKDDFLAELDAVREKNSRR